MEHKSIWRRKSIRLGVLVAGILLFMVPGTRAQGGGKKQFKILVTPASARLSVGEEVSFEARVMDKDGQPVDTAVVWSLTRPIGTLSEEGLFVASVPGSGQVVATVGSVSGRAHVTVLRDSSGLDALWRVVIQPGDTAVYPGAEIPFTAALMDTFGVTRDTTFTWTVDDPVVGAIDSSGLFEALSRGHTFVRASVGTLAGRVHVNVLRDSTAWKQMNRGYKIYVEPRDTLLAPGSTLQYAAVLMDTLGQTIDTTFSWSVGTEEYFGEITEAGLFTALEQGQGFVFASVGEITGKGHVVVRDTAACDTCDQDSIRVYRLQIVPRDTLVLVGDQVQFRAQLVDTLGTAVDTTVDWRLLGRKVGTLTGEGLFTAERTGSGIVRARLGRYTAHTKVLVASEADTAQADSVRIRFRHRDGHQLGNIHRLAEKDILKISGLPFPLNVLNGGEVIFPPGSLTEEISLDITLTDAAEVFGDSTLTYKDQILAGIAFHVYVNDTLVSPYYFEDPVQIVIPYKEELLDQLGLTPDDLWVFFYNEASEMDSAGITNVVVDTAEKKIYAEAGHFSDLVVASIDCACTSVETVDALPGRFRLYANYPNPFNPETMIRFTVPSGGAKEVSLVIYNMLGQQVRTLVQGALAAGEHAVRWDGKDETGRTLSSGIYIYQLRTPDFHETRRMILMR